MKKIMIVALVLFTALNSTAQGITFFEGRFDEALAKAKAEDKLLFIDFYTVWCGPCKMMSKEIFPQPKVGDYFNEKFISFKLDAEKGEGIEIAKKYEVKGYPTLLFLNPDGTEKKRLVGATPDADFFLSFAKQVTGEEIAFLDMYKAYEEGERDLDYIRDLILSGGVYASTLAREEQRDWYKKFAEMAHWFFAFKKPSETVNPKDFKLIARYLDGPNNGNPFVEYVYNNYEAYKKVVPIAELSMFIQRTNNQSIHDSYQKGNLKFREYLAAVHGRLAQVYADDEKADADDTYTVMKYVAEAGYCLHGLKDVDGYLDWNEKYKAYQKQHGKLDARSYMATVGNALYAAKNFITDKQVKRLMGEIEKGLKLDPKATSLIDNLGDCHALLGEKEKAAEQYNLVIEYAKGGKGEEYYKEKMTEKISGLK